MPPETNKVSSDPRTARIATLVQKFALLGRKIERVRSRVAQTEENMDAIVCEFGDLLRDLLGVLGCAVPPARGGPTAGSRHVGVTRRPRLRPRETSPEVVHAVLVTQSDHSTVVEIEGRSSIPLPPFVAALLEILKAEGGIRKDHLVGWKPVAFIQSALEERTKQYHSKVAVKELVFRLRNLLEDHGEARLLVQQNRRLGYRFAVRSGAGAVIDRDNQ